MQHNTLERGNPLRVYEGKEFRLKQIMHFERNR
jgi:hypothetical protein